ncbi:hypothetical protein BDP55DRAFT_101459 [Colletotrichum godetiae]|uniref:Uncharacterized protein n=1 Tax=Colletotrichum godetiae TaxID=1209918 RepID=A0AAJ0AMX6_9PEZI|nr:uncharacterized protein BDP55DRAFT_101459 [Colletotrichum godetiae]KAK1676819.1 hypothetical protein BDP55DRAFT_101459 [Colletotrichum godetiae]
MPACPHKSRSPAPKGTGRRPPWSGRQTVPSEAPTRLAREIPSKCRTLQMIPPISQNSTGRRGHESERKEGDPAGCASARTSMGTVPTTPPTIITEILPTSSGPNRPRNSCHHDSTQPHNHTPKGHASRATLRTRSDHSVQ